jgi:hypothetical protein
MGLVEYVTSDLSNQKPIYDPPGLNLALAEARILGSSEEREAVGRLRVTAFLRDRPGVLPTVLETLRQGIRVEGAGPSIRFSIDGSYSASVDDISSLVLVAHPLIEPVAGHDALRSSLQKELELALGSEVGDALYRAVSVQPFRDDCSDSTLFWNRNFVEFRFGVSATNGSAAAQIFTPLLRQFTSFLGQEKVPIAYFYFPHSWSRAAAIGVDDVDLTHWLRLAIGADPSQTSTLDIEKRASELSDEFGCALCLYAPWSEKESMGDKFELITNLSSQNSLGSDEEQESRSVVFVEGEARADLVASMLRSDVPTTIFAASMGVLLGHTVVSWVVDQREGDEFADYLRKVADDPRELEASAYPMPQPDVFDGHTDKMCKPFWIAWRCRDEVAVMARIFSVLDSFVDDLDDRDVEPRLNVEYAMSRVLQRGQTCAGKIKFSGGAIVVDGIIGRHKDLEELIADALEAALLGWEAPVASWADQPVIVRSTEPGEDPWAELIVSPFSGGQIEH